MACATPRGDFEASRFATLLRDLSFEYQKLQAENSRLRSRAWSPRDERHVLEVQAQDQNGKYTPKNADLAGSLACLPPNVPQVRSARSSGRRYSQTSLSSINEFGDFDVDGQVHQLRQAAAFYVDSKYKKTDGQEMQEHLGSHEPPRSDKTRQNGVHSGEAQSVKTGYVTVDENKLIDLTPSWRRWQTLLKFAKESVKNTQDHCHLHPTWAFILQSEGSDSDFFSSGQNLLSGIALTQLPVAKMSSVKSQQELAFCTMIGTNVEADATNSHRSTYRWPVIQPSSKPRLLWDLLGILLLTHDMITIPLGVFASGTVGLGQSYLDFREVLDLCGGVFWSFDMVVSFMTGFYLRDGVLEMRPKQIAFNYLRTWFPMDLTIVFVDWLSFGLGKGAGSGYMRLGKTISRFMRIVRLLRFMKLNVAFKEWMATINSEYILTIVGLIKIVLMIVLINHYIACFWYYLSRIPNTERTWSKKFLDHTDSLGYAYSTSLHWALTQFTPASMEVVPQNLYERFFNAFVIIIALVAFSSFVSSITQAMTHIRLINQQQFEMEASIRRYFGEKRISRELAGRVWHFFRQNRIMAVRRLKEADVPALAELPRSIKEALRQEAFLPVLAIHPLFFNLSRIEPGVCHRLCGRAMREESLMHGEEAFTEHKKAGRIKEMLFVLWSELNYIDSSQEDNSIGNDHFHESHTPTVDTGQWACELALWADGARLNGNLVAGHGGCELLLLHAGEFQVTMSSLGTVGISLIAKYAVRYVTAWNNAKEDISYTGVFLNEIDFIQDLLSNSFEDLGDRNNFAGWGVFGGKIKRPLSRQTFKFPRGGTGALNRSSTTSASSEQKTKSQRPEAIGREHEKLVHSHTAFKAALRV